MKNQKSIDQIYASLPNESFICYWHKMDIINAYCDLFWHKWLSKQNFEYSFDVQGQKCQIENCPCDAEIKLVKKTKQIGVVA